MAILKWIGIVFIIPIVLFILLISVNNWNWARDLATHQISELTHRNFTIHGDLTIDWSLVPKIRLEKIKLENAKWGNQPHMLELAAIDFTIDLMELLKGHVIFPEITLTKPHIILEKSPDGKGNWEFQTDTNDKNNSKEFPIAERVRIIEGHLIYQDLSANSELLVTFATTGKHANNSEATKLEAKGKLHGRPLTINLNAGPLVALREAKQPYPMTFKLQTEKTSIEVNGTLTQPIQLKNIDLQFNIKGPDPEQLSHTLGVSMPNLPLYQLKGNLSRHKDIWQIKSLNGYVGNSDFVGNIVVNNVKEQLHITADLTSKKIDLDDFGPLPQSLLPLKKLQEINANISIRSKLVESKLPINDLKMHIIIKEGHLIVSPVDFGIGKGNIRSRLEFDTKSQPIKGKIETEIHHVSLGEILRRFKISDKSVGLIGGQGIFWFNGNSVPEMLASADGGLLMLMTGGRLDGFLVELAGLDIGEALVALFDKDDNTEINCAFVDLPTSGGTMDMKTFIVDTEDTVFLGSGSIDFNKEHIDLVIDPKPKDLSVFSARAPLYIKGSFKDPTFTPGASAILRGAVSLALLPSAPIVSLYSLLEKEKIEQNSHKQENIYCTGLENAINNARK